MKQKNNGSLIKMKRAEILSGYIFLIPVLSLLGLFVFYGLFYVIKLSFYKWDGFIPDTMVFRGLKNYKILFSDPLFFKSLANVFIFMVSTVTIQMFLGLTIALYLKTD